MRVRVLRSALFLFLVMGMGMSGKGQDLYDLDNSLRYSQYLFHTQQYRLAAEELERVIYLAPGVDSLNFQLVRSYLLDRQFEMGRRRLETLFPETGKMPGIYASRYSGVLMSLDKYAEAADFLRSAKNLAEGDRLFKGYQLNLLTSDWDAARLSYRSLLDQHVTFDREYTGIMEQIANARYSSPGLALALSAVLPGSGKVYTGNWKDGLVSLIFVGGTAFQAYRGYKTYGPGSGFFIGYATVAGSFYLGNLYGSFKAARKKNQQINSRIHDRIKAVVDRSY